jgi:hypothetical protein
MLRHRSPCRRRSGIAVPTSSSGFLSREQFVINRGDLDLSSSGGRIAVSGTRGFSLTAAVTRSGGILEAFDACLASNCDPGWTIPLEAAWSGTDLPATMTLDGKTYTQIGSLATATAAAVRFSGTVLAPPITNRGSQTVTAPFSVRRAIRS